MGEIRRRFNSAQLDHGRAHRCAHVVRVDNVAECEHSFARVVQAVNLQI